MGYSEIIKEGILPEYDKALTRIRKHCAELATIIDSLLTAARIEAGASSVESQEVHLGDFLNKLRSLYDIPLDKELTLVWDYPSELPLIKTDSGKLKHILQNLVNNAIKFTEKGLVTISAQIKAGSRQRAEGNRNEGSVLTPHASRLTPTGLSPQASGRYVELKVADTGIGIPKEKISIIFEMFGQVDSSKTRSHGGVGLGLYIVKTFTEMLGGKIDVESESGKGSAFTVTIPCESQ
jgi:two-component system chemotaxis sensor kinase CheA